MRLIQRPADTDKQLSRAQRQREFHNYLAGTMTHRHKHPHLAALHMRNGGRESLSPRMLLCCLTPAVRALRTHSQPNTVRRVCSIQFTIIRIDTSKPHMRADGTKSSPCVLCLGVVTSARLPVNTSRRTPKHMDTRAAYAHMYHVRTYAISQNACWRCVAVADVRVPSDCETDIIQNSLRALAKSCLCCSERLFERPIRANSISMRYTHARGFVCLSTRSMADYPTSHI